MEYGSKLTGMQISVDLTPETADDVVEIRKTKKKKEPYPPYTIVGNGKSSKRGASMDIIDVCSEFNLAENKLLQFFRDCLLDNNVNREIELNTVTPTKYEVFDDYLKTALKKNYAHMEYMGVIKRIKRGTYMVNPTLFIPSTNYESIKHKWDLLVSDSSLDGIS